MWRSRRLGGKASIADFRLVDDTPRFLLQFLIAAVAGAGLFFLGLELGSDFHPRDLLLRAAGLHPIVLVLWAASCLLCLAAALNRHRALRRMRRMERSYRDLYENISEGVFRSTLDGRMLSANPSLVRLNGYETEEELLNAVNDIAGEWYVDPNRRAEIHAMLMEHGRVSNVISEIRRHGTRERIWIEESTRLVRDRRTGEPLFYDGTVREVTETVRRLELQDHYDKIASIVSGCLYQFRLRPDGTSCLPYASIGLVHLYGIEPEAVREDASAVFERLHPDDVALVQSSITESARDLTAWQCEFRLRLPNGKEKWIFGHSVPEREADGSVLWHGYLTDISERKRSEARIHELAYFDPLTKLPNRTMLLESLRRAIGAAGHGQLGAILFIDLDHFKILNDTKGHHAGDLLLSEMADRLRSCIGRRGAVGRLGGDEFVVLLRELGEDRDQAVRHVGAMGEMILAAVGRPFQFGGQWFQTTASIGVALFDARDRKVDDLLRKADLAMYEAKTAGRDTIRFFEARMQADLEEKLALSNDLREALRLNQLELFYQVQVDGSGRCFGAEALLRWDHPERGAVSPAEILPVAERSGMIRLLDEWVLNRACTTLRSWQEDPLTAELRLSVNVSARQLDGAHFVASVKKVLQETGADPGRLNLELTEHVMLENMHNVVAAMAELRALGVTFALDDFGTGYSSLSYLKQLPIETLKIDQSFVRDIEHDQNDRAIIETIVGMARSLKLAIVAEGVEREMQALLLRQLGCHAFQGYLFGTPMALPDFLADLRARQSAREDELTAATPAA